MSKSLGKKIAVLVAICFLFSSIVLSANIVGVELGNNASAAYEQTVYTFNYTGNVQNVTLKKGRYLFECYGAQGGDTGGGKGGYSKGALYIQNDMTLYIYVGQKGRNAQPYSNSQGGWNGGGSGGSNTDGLSSSSGGGASDIRLVNGSWSDTASLKSRLIVAGGGGGGNSYRADISGGAGGGVSGGIASKFGLTVYGGTQTSGGTGNTNGGFGYGGSGCDSIYGSRITGGGGGGGYYGGGGGIAYSNDVANTYRCSGGAGGSSFISGHIGCNAIDLNGNPTGQPVHSSGLFFTQTEMQQGVQAGDGFVKITLLTSPSVSITSGENEAFSTNLLIKGMLNNTYSDKILFNYQIDEGNEKIAKESITSKGTDLEFDIKSIDIRTLKVGTHTLKLWTSDETGWLSDKLTVNFIKIDALRIIPVNSSSTAIEVSILDNDVLNTQYQLSVNSAYVTEEGTLTRTPGWIRREENSVTASAIKIVGLEPETKYKVQIKARHSDELDGVTYNTIECKTGYSQLEVPRINSFSESNKITLSWVPVSEATEYEINADGVVSTTSALSFSDKNLLPDTAHIYRIRSKNLHSFSEWSLPIKVSTKKALPEIPANITAAAIGTSISVSWDKVSSALNYEIEADGAIKTVNGTSYTISGLKPATLHTFRVRTVGFSGTSSWSAIERIYTTDGLITAMPQNLTALASNSTVTLNWEAVEDAEGYEILPVLEGGAMGTAVDNGSLTTCEFRGLKPATEYRYVVRAKNSAGEGPYSSQIQVTTYLLGTPGNVKSEKNDSSITFSWDKVESADSYQLIYTGAAGGETGGTVTAGELESSGIRVDVPTGTSVTINSLTPCTEYKYSIRAKSSNGYSSWREVKSCFTLPHRPEIPDNVSASVSDSKIIISWTGMDDPAVTGYDIELDGIVLENDIEASYIHEGLTPYSLHTYRVRARNELVEGEWSPENTIRTLPSAPQSPKNIIIKSTQTGATLTWKEEQGAAGYDVYVYRLDESNNEVKVEEISNIEDCTYTHRRQIKGEEYRYRLRTRNVHGLSPWSGDIINNAIKAQCKKGNTLDLGLTATDVVDFGSYEMVVTYNPGVAEVADLSTLTGAAELTAGKIEGTGITIKEFSQGRIVFVVDKAVTPGEAWTGVINGIKFKARETGGTTITYTVFTRQE